MDELASGRLRHTLSAADLIAQLSGFFEEAIQGGARLALTMDYADAIIPALQGAYESAEERAVRVHFLKWASEPQFVATDFSVCLITDELARIDPQLAQHARVATIALPLPTSAERLAFLSWLQEAGSSRAAQRTGNASPPSMSHPSLAEHTAGMSLVQIQALLAEAQQPLGGHTPALEPPVLSASTVADYKKRAIEQEARDLLSFIPPSGNLDDVAGHQAAIAKLRRMARLVREGRSHESLPMGYLISGPVGTGKTHLVSKLAGEMGIPMVTLKNFRSQWQGGTEANLEKIFALLAALQPVAVVIDEADAALGTRHARGDAGVSGRVFSALASYMSRPQHRGKIMFFLLTSRPDLLPVDLKRQGRAEEHISLFYPEEPAEREAVIRWFLTRSGMGLTYDDLPEAVRNPGRPLSGAEIESLLARTRLEAAADDVPVTPELLQYVWDTFLPPDYAEDVRYQTLVAALECTDRSLLPPSLRDLDRADLAARVRREAR
jgi:SpoVK/Ycf46/Vps4 family AAA+-type ATPase